MKSILLVSFLFLPLVLFSWTSSNQGLNYTMDDLCSLSDSISYNDSLSQYNVECDINILENDTLIINPGQIVEFIMLIQIGNTEFYGIKIYGKIEAIGEEQNPITLGDPEKTYYDGNFWNGIRFYNQNPDEQSILQYCNIIAANDRLGLFGLYCLDSSPIIDHCIFTEMNNGFLTGGGSAIYCAGNSNPLVSYCTFGNIHYSVALWCGGEWIDSYGLGNWAGYTWGYQDTLNYPSPLMYNCNIMPSVGGFFGYTSNFESVLLLGGFLDNCYIGFTATEADTTLGYPIDTIGDGICTTTSTYSEQKFILVDGVVNPRSTPEFTDINDNEINILPTTSEYLILDQNYPNPFNPSTTITFIIVKEITENIELVIFNVKGQKVKHLINEPLPIGQHSITWFGDDDNSESVTSGVYFYKLSVGKEMKVKKAIVVK